MFVPNVPFLGEGIGSGGENMACPGQIPPQAVGHPSLNKERTEFSTRPGEFEKKSKRIEREIDSICASIDFHRLSYDESRDSYEIDYYTWQEHLGELRRITVQLTSTGQADVVDDTVVAKKLGYYWPYVY
jgi:hypothetical protein